ncbi:MAG: hypothetical protein AB7S26_18065 [Sandaracinaceae bacterium]
MTEPKTRRVFLVETVGVAAATAFAVGCGDGGGDDAGPPRTDSGGGGSCTPASTIADNHAHVLMIPEADLSSATDVTYDIMGGSPHNHTVTLTAAQLATLAGGGMVTVTSSETNAHSHGVTITCA